MSPYVISLSIFLDASCYRLLWSPSKEFHPLFHDDMMRNISLGNIFHPLMVTKLRRYDCSHDRSQDRSETIEFNYVSRRDGRRDKMRLTEGNEHKLSGLGGDTDIVEATKDKVQTTNLGSTAHVQPPVIKVPMLDPDVAPKPKPKPSMPYLSRLNDQKLREKANYQMLKLLQIFQRLHFDLSFVDALLHIPKFASTFKSLLIECLALADLGASINLMPLSVWKKLSLPELTPTRMTLERANRLVSYPVGIAKDVFVKVGKF
ncbi:reverse transcriptase domain-containing protein [Tanacetum coccineum]